MSGSAQAGDGPAIGQLSCSMASTLVRHLRATLTDEAVQEVIRLSGVEYDAAYLDDVSNWIWLDEAVALFEAAATVTGDQNIGRRVGEETVRQHAGTAVATLLRSLGSPEAVYEQLAVGVTKFSTITKLTPENVGPGRATVHVKPREGYRRHRHLCDRARPHRDRRPRRRPRPDHRPRRDRRPRAEVPACRPHGPRRSAARAPAGLRRRGPRGGRTRPAVRR